MSKIVSTKHRLIVSDLGLSHQKFQNIAVREILIDYVDGLTTMYQYVISEDFR